MASLDINYRRAQLDRLTKLQGMYGLRPNLNQEEQPLESGESGEGSFKIPKLGQSLIMSLILLVLSLFYVSKGGSLFALFLAPAILFFKNQIDKSKQLAIQKKFIAEYPAVMLATASNLKAGLSVYSALERAIQLLEKDSLVRAEIKSLLDKVSRGVKKEDAVEQFAKDISLPEIRLFRRAFLMVLSNGGKFSRTLERLSEVCRDRESLIQSSKVSTASMRMTGNVLLGVAPFLLFMLSVRTKDFWNILLYNPTASKLAGIGSFIILTAYYILRRLSDFKP